MQLKQLPAIRINCGFTYVGLLILIAIMGVMLATIGTFWHTTQQRAKEKQLLSIGNQFSRAITAYYLNSPGGAHQFPRKLEDLVQDKRFPTTTRYLRKVFADPFTATTNWGLIKGADGGITGVYSLSDIVPIKQDNFPKGNEALAGKKHVSEWQFTYRLSATTSVASTGAAGTSIPAAPANPIPPAYQVPPLQPLPADSSVTPRKANQCQLMLVSDAASCANVGAKFGDAAGATCMASARLRNTICMGNDPGAPMPVLDVQYQ